MMSRSIARLPSAPRSNDVIVILHFPFDLGSSALIIIRIVIVHFFLFHFTMAHILLMMIMNDGFIFVSGKLLDGILLRIETV